jgi:ring-1,2-phenylacetyl-CoA epoxidase subunit PaaE
MHQATPKFHALPIQRITPENGDSARITFAVPNELREAYLFNAGQYLTLRAMIGDQSVRRSYSICSAEQAFVDTGLIEVGVKRVQGGLFSNWVLNCKAGDLIDVMTPEGKFGEFAVALIPEKAHPEKAHPEKAHPEQVLPEKTLHLVAYVAGSGITPVLAMMSTWLARSPTVVFSLVYGNRRSESVMFLEDIASLKNQYMERVRLYHVLSRQPQESELFNGRLDRVKIEALSQVLLPIGSIDHAFVCGPNNMIDEVEAGLLSAGLASACVHSERFGVPGPRHADPVKIDSSAPAAQLFVVLDGKQSEMRLPYGGIKVLDVALDHGLDLPFACKGGVCCTCRAKVLEGEVVMEKNYSLEDHEIAKGFVLTCQAVAKSEKVVISYDDR